MKIEFWIISLKFLSFLNALGQKWLQAYRLKDGFMTFKRWDYLLKQVELSLIYEVSFFVKWNTSSLSMPQPFYIKFTQEPATVFCPFFTFGICTDSVSQKPNR